MTINQIDNTRMPKFQITLKFIVILLETQCVLQVFVSAYNSMLVTYNVLIALKKSVVQ